MNNQEIAALMDWLGEEGTFEALTMGEAAEIMKAILRFTAAIKPIYDRHNPKTEEENKEDVIELLNRLMGKK